MYLLSKNKLYNPNHIVDKTNFVCK